MSGRHSRHFHDMSPCQRMTCHLGGSGNMTRRRHFQLRRTQKKQNFWLQNLLVTSTPTTNKFESWLLTNLENMDTLVREHLISLSPFFVNKWAHNIPTCQSAQHLYLSSWYHNIQLYSSNLQEEKFVMYVFLLFCHYVAIAHNDNALIFCMSFSLNIYISSGNVYKPEDF